MTTKPGEKSFNCQILAHGLSNAGGAVLGREAVLFIPSRPWCRVHTTVKKILPYQGIGFYILYSLSRCSINAASNEGKAHVAKSCYDLGYRKI
jgi:hypothetical protein